MSRNGKAGLAPAGGRLEGTSSEPGWPISGSSCAAYKDRFIRLGMSDAMAQGYTDMARAKNQGLDNGVQRTPQNSTPTSFRQWCEEVLKSAVTS